MHAAGHEILKGFEGSDFNEVTPGLIARAVAALALPVVTLTGAAFFFQGQAQDTANNMDATVSGAVVAHAAYAYGVSQGMSVSGIHVPDETINRISSLVSEDIVVRGDMNDARLSGMEEALSGNWTNDRLDAYLDMIEATHPRISQITEANRSLFEQSGMSPENSVGMARYYSALVLLEGNGRLKLSLDAQPDTEIASALRSNIEDMRSHMREIGITSGIDPEIVRKISKSMIRDHISASDHQASPSF